MSGQAGSKMIQTWKQWEGQVVNGQFHLSQYLGGSDHSAVFLTERGPDGHKAAIKLIWAESKSAELQLSRWGEVAKLSHPHLIRLFEMGRCELRGSRLLYVVMEYAEENLSQILPQRALTPAESREMLLPVLSALTHLHAKGLVHGHLRPSNIMAVADEVKISSDGISRSGESSGSKGRRSPYDAPETVTEGFSPAGDVWSLAMTLVEALTQLVPLCKETESEEVILPEPLGTTFADIARHCLVRDPKFRSTVGQIAAHLQGTAPGPKKVGAMAPEKPPAKGRFRIGIAIAGIALLAILAGARLFNRQPAGPKLPAPSVADDQQVSPTPVPRSSPSPETAKASAAGSVKGTVVHQVLPNVSQGARNTIQGTVRVRVKVEVDPSGNVTDASFDSAGPSKYFARVAMQAAREWKFRPAQVDGDNVASEWILRFGFGRSATQVSAAQTAP